MILHGGAASAVDAKLQQLGLPPLQGGDLPVNPFPRLRVVWSPLASDNPRVPGNAAEQYYPGAAYVDVEGGDIYDERLTDTAPWQGLEKLYQLRALAPQAVLGAGVGTVPDRRPDVRAAHVHVPEDARAPRRWPPSTRAGPASIFDLESKPRAAVPTGRASHRSAGRSPAGPPIADAEADRA